MMADRAAALYGRLALGTAFLSAVSSRLGIWGGTWKGFEEWARTDVLAFMPSPFVHPMLVLATCAELSIGLLLVAGIQTRKVAYAAAGLLACFAISMALSAGLKSPFDYSVFSASACAVLLARAQPVVSSATSNASVSRARGNSSPRSVTPPTTA